MMNDYKIGSLADLFSQNKGITIKLHKNEQTPTGNECETNVDEPVIKGQKSKQKSKSVSLKEDSQNVRSPVTSLDEATLENKTAVNKKKRKNLKSEDLESKNVSNKKKRKILTGETAKSSQKEVQSLNRKPEIGIDLNFIPSDSNKGDKKKEKKIKAKLPPSQTSNKFRQYKDFTECTIFVGNIPINYDTKKISKIFSKFGKIQSARIRCVPIADINTSKKVAAIKKQFNVKRNSLVAYVKYKTQDSANAALEANGMLVDGHHLRVDLAERHKENDNNKAVFVGGLPFDIEDDDLWEFFQNCGKINSVRVIRDSQTLIGKGFGYVNFDSTAAVELALQMDGQELKKRTINVKRCIKSRKKSKLNAFGKKKSKEMADKLLCKRGKKFKEEKKKEQNESQIPGNFQGRKADIKEKKKKKLSKAALRQRKLVKILGASKR